ncbi:lipocalin-like domain-containing protein [Vibrio sp. F74]
MKMPVIKRNIVIMLAAILVILVAGLFYYFSFGRSSEKETITYAFSNSQKSVFEPVLPGVSVSFPDSFSFHHEFKREGWQYFANLVGEDGELYSVQWNYYRIARNESEASGWNSTQLYLSNSVVTSKDKVWKQQRIARGGIGQAGFRARPFRLWIDNWSWRSISSSPLPGILQVETDDFALKLSSSSLQGFILNGDKGYQEQHDLLPIAAYGFGAPSVRSSGQLILDGKVVTVNGQAWLSKEWGSDLAVIEGQKAVTVNLHLADGGHLKLNQTRIPNYPVYNYGMLVKRDGSILPLADTDIVMSALGFTPMENGKLVPLTWQISIEKLDIDLIITPLRDDLWHAFYNPYWQGSVSAMGTQDAYGMLQLTGF